MQATGRCNFECPLFSKYDKFALEVAAIELSADTLNVTIEMSYRRFF